MKNINKYNPMAATALANSLPTSTIFAEAAEVVVFAAVLTEVLPVDVVLFADVVVEADDA
jgi:hypothetical protein